MKHICSIDGCETPVLARGWCNKHYARWRNYGDPLMCFVNQTPAGEPKRFLQNLPQHGDGCVTWPYSRNNMGYGQIYIDGKKYLAHRIACTNRHGALPSELHVAAHNCGMGHKGCVAPWHLEWKTRAENCADAFAHGTAIFGELAAQKLTAHDICIIRNSRGKLSQSQLSKIYGVGQSYISRIQLRKVWKSVQ